MGEENRVVATAGVVRAALLAAGEAMRKVPGVLSVRVDSDPTAGEIRLFLVDGRELGLVLCEVRGA